MNYVVHIRIKPTSRSVPVNSFIGLPPNGDDKQALIRDLSSQYGYSWVTIPGLTPVTGLPPGGITGQIVARDLDDPYGYVWVNPQAGPKGDDGEPGASGDDGRSAYQVAVDNGFVGSESAWLASLKGDDGEPGTPGADGAPGAVGDDGRSAYQVAVDNGFVGSESAWLASLKGDDGEPGTPGADGAPGAVGDDGRSAYQIAVDNGFVGSESAWLASLKGDDGEPGTPGADGAPGAVGDDGRSAYQVAVDNGFVGSELAWLASLKGDDGEPGTPGANGLSAYQVALANGFVGTEAQWLASLQGDPGTPGSVTDPIDEASISNDFLSRNQGAAWTESGISSGTTPQPSYAELMERPGVIKFNSSATANSGYYMLTLASYVVASANTVTRLIFKLFDNDAFSLTKIRFGLHGATTAADGSNEISLIVLGGSASGVCRKAGVVQSSPVATLTHGVWYGAKITINSSSSSVLFEVFNAVTKALIGSVTISTNIPEVALRHGVTVTSSGTAARDLTNVDYIDLKVRSLNRSF